MTQTPAAVLAVPCPTCNTRIGTQCTIARGNTAGEFDIQQWSHIRRIALSIKLKIAEPTEESFV